MNALKAIMGLGASLALAGCYLPELPAGTQRITGGSGQSSAACFVVGASPESCLDVGSAEAGWAVVSTEVVLEAREQGGFQGRFQFSDRTSKLVVVGTAWFSAIEQGAEEGPVGAVFEGPVRYRFEGEKFKNGWMYGSVVQAPAGVPGDTRKEDDPRHAMALCLVYGSAPTAADTGCDRGYWAIFDGGNYILHGANGVIAR